MRKKVKELKQNLEEAYAKDGSPKVLVAIELFINTYEMYSEATEHIKKEGAVIEHLTDNKFKTLKPSPWVKIQQDTQIQLHKLIQDFGLTPRTKLEESSTEELSPIEKLLLDG